LIPSQFSQLAPVNSISAIIEWSVTGVLDPSLRFFDTEHPKQPSRQVEVRNFVSGVNVVGLTNFSLVKDCVEGRCCIAGEEVPSRVAAIAVDEERHLPAKQIDELWNNLYFTSAS
jgi:hypothetical protein